MDALDQACDEPKHGMNAACSDAARTVRLQITDELNHFLRRLRQYRTEGEWVSAVVDAASRFAPQIAVFALSNGVLSVRGHHGLNLSEKLSFAVASAGAFASAVATKDPVIALRTPSEVSQALAASDVSERVCVIPILNETRVVAVLFAGGGEHIDVNALELIAGIASAVLERRSNTSLHAQVVAAAPVQNGGTPRQTANRSGL
jgi:hypothetical protein